MSAQQPPNGLTVASENSKEKPKEHKRTMSYAEVASKGPKQSPEEAAAPQPPSLLATTSSPSSSLIDVDTPSVHTVPSTFASQEIKTETQAARREREEEAAAERAAAAAAARARAEADLARKKAARAREGAAGWLGALFGWNGPGGGVGGVVNALAVVGVGGWLGMRGWGLYERGRLGWKEVGVGLGVLGAVGAVEGVVVNYLSKSRAKEQ